MRSLLSKLKISLSLLAVLTTSTVLSYIDWNPSPKSATTNVLAFSKDTQNIVDVTRKPATAENSRQSVLEAKVFCSTETDTVKLKVEQPLVMMDLVLCETAKSNRHIWVRNNTNGFRAQVFSLRSNKFRTDFIQLNPGLNKIEIETVLKDGQKRVQAVEISQGS